VTKSSLARPDIDPERLAALARIVTGTAGHHEVLSPLDNRPLATVPRSDEADVDRALAAARVAQVEWALRPLGERRAILRHAGRMFLAHRDELLDLIQLENGKNRLSAFEEVSDIALTAAYYARTSPRLMRSRRRRGVIPVLTSVRELRIPKGVVGVISPWNYPLMLAVADAIPALIAGNAVVLKPDSATPLCALAAVEILREAGVPPDLFGVVIGAGSTLGPRLIDGVDYVMFTGSTATGRTIAEQCGRRLIDCSAELGGKNPLIVLADADIDRAAHGAVQACFSNSGQLCVSIERIYVEDTAYGAFASAFVRRVGAMRLGVRLDWEADIGSLTSADQLAVVSAHVDDAVAKGATVLAGGKARPDIGPYCYEPTVLEGVTDDMAVARAETFGPVVSLYRVADADEAVRLANDTPYGLNASVWSRRRGVGVARRVLAGTVSVNEGYAAAWGSTDAAMGGVKDSGLGRRHGDEGLLKYTEPQTVLRQRIASVAPPDRVSDEAYAKFMTRALALLTRLRP
jgi:succinate-semialdehyde dehydrogenase/glutarate-semialdehyde dehydrogenase